MDLLESSSFGSKLCEDCYPHQYSPLIDDAWKRKNFGKDLFKGDFINLGIGQGYMLTTPLHLSLIAGILASKGQYRLPYLVRENDNFEISIIKPQEIKYLGEDQSQEIEKRILLQTIDLNWKSHIQYLENLRQVVSLRGYAQRDPLVEYKKEAFNLFENLLNKLKFNIITFLINIKMKD
mgnify:CR=1 FL=1